jgi:hypothetical protein
MHVYQHYVYNSYRNTFFYMVVTCPHRHCKKKSNVKWSLRPKSAGFILYTKHVNSCLQTNANKTKPDEMLKDLAKVEKMLPAVNELAAHKEGFACSIGCGDVFTTKQNRDMHENGRVCERRADPDTHNVCVYCARHVAKTSWDRHFSDGSKCKSRLKLRQRLLEMQLATCDYVLFGFDINVALNVNNPDVEDVRAAGQSRALYDLSVTNTMQLNERILQERAKVGIKLLPVLFEIYHEMIGRHLLMAKTKNRPQDILFMTSLAKSLESDGATTGFWNTTAVALIAQQITLFGSISTHTLLAIVVTENGGILPGKNAAEFSGEPVDSVAWRNARLQHIDAGKKVCKALKSLLTYCQRSKAEDVGTLNVKHFKRSLGLYSTSLIQSELALTKVSMPKRQRTPEEIARRLQEEQEYIAKRARYQVNCAAIRKPAPALTQATVEIADIQLIEQVCPHVGSKK